MNSLLVILWLCLLWPASNGQHSNQAYPKLESTEHRDNVHRVMTFTRTNAPRQPYGPKPSEEILAKYSLSSSSFDTSGPQLASYQVSQSGSSSSSSASSSSSSSSSSFSFSNEFHGQPDDSINRLRQWSRQHQTPDEHLFKLTTSAPISSWWSTIVPPEAPENIDRPSTRSSLSPDLTCPVCYRLVEQQVLDLRAFLNDLVDQLEEIRRRPEVVEDLGFQLRLRELASAVDALLRDAQFAASEERALAQQLNELRARAQKVAAVRDSITQLPELGRALAAANSNATHVHNLLARVSGGLTDARAFLDRQAVDALSQAWDRSRQFGRHSNRLSELARLSRLLAEQHSTDAAEIAKLATESLNTSQTAFKLAKDAISTRQGNKLAMQKLNRHMKSTEQLLIKTFKIAEEAQKEALRAYNDALDIYSKSSPTIPSMRSEKVNQDSAWITSQSIKIIQEVQKLLSRYELGADGGNAKLTEAKHLLYQAQQLQADTDRVLAETQANLARAQAAIESGELTLKDAQNTLKTLKEFDQLVGSSKTSAEEALRKVEEIHNLVKEAELKTEQAEKALKGALQDAQEARDTALEAHKIAERASLQVRKLKEVALGVKGKASEMKKRLDLFNVRIEESSTRIVQCEGDGTQDAQAVRDALEKANQAKNSALDALKKIKSAINTLDSILEELESLDQVDASLLEELFQRLAKAEQEYKDADLDNRSTNLIDARDQQRKWVADYERLIAKLISDVNNVDKIRQALPDKCFRRVRLEP